MPDRPETTNQFIQAAALTDPGHRKNNEDAPVLVYGTDAGRKESDILFGVVDGMGGYEAGEVASEIAADHLAERYGEDGGDIASWIVSAHEAIVANSQEHPERRGMGAVVSVGLISGNTLTIGHVGDTRIYRLRNSELQQLTEDHSAVGELVRTGSLDKELARTHRMSNVVLQAIGHDDKPPTPSVYEETIMPGDLFLACSDGLTDVITEQEIVDILAQNLSLEDTTHELVAAALTDHPATSIDGGQVIIKGGKDNISVVLVRIGEIGEGSGSPGEKSGETNRSTSLLSASYPGWLLFSALGAALVFFLFAITALVNEDGTQNTTSLQSEYEALVAQSAENQQTISNLRRGWHTAHAAVAERDSALGALMDSVYTGITRPAPALTPAPADTDSARTEP